jgi:hypothetical protein
MRRRPGVLVLGLITLVAAAVVVQASAAAPTRAAGSASTIDATYSCRVSSQHDVSLFGSVDLPPANGRAQPGVFVLNTGTKSVTKNGTTTTVSQIGFSSRKNSLRIDKGSCQRVKKQIPLKSKGLSGPPSTATATEFGHVSESCSAARVLVRLRITLTAGAPTHALVAVRNDNAKNRPIAFVSWNRRKVVAYTANNCTDIS